MGKGYNFKCQFCGTKEYRTNYIKAITCFKCKKERSRLRNKKKP